VVLLLCVGAASCGRKNTRVRAPITPARAGTTETGMASWYGVPYHGRRTASGEIYDMEQLTAAHRELPFQTWVEVTNLENGKTVDVRITDRGPFVRGRIIDLSRAAARDIGMLGPGVVKVRLKIIAASEVTPSLQTTVRSGNAPALPQPPPATGPPLIAYTVQAGAFADRERAESLRQRVAEAFGEARVVSAEGTPPLWRVVVGRGITLEEANELATRVRQQIGDALIIVDRSAVNQRGVDPQITGPGATPQVQKSEPTPESAK